MPTANTLPSRKKSNRLPSPISLALPHTIIESYMCDVPVCNTRAHQPTTCVPNMQLARATIHRIVYRVSICCATVTEKMEQGSKQTFLLYCYVLHCDYSFSSSLPSYAGRRCCTSLHDHLPFTTLAIASTISSRLARTCFVLSRSRSVNVPAVLPSSDS